MEYKDESKRSKECIETVLSFHFLFSHYVLHYHVNYIIVGLLGISRFLTRIFITANLVVFKIAKT